MLAGSTGGRRRNCRTVRGGRELTGFLPPRIEPLHRPDARVQPQIDVRNARQPMTPTLPIAMSGISARPVGNSASVSRASAQKSLLPGSSVICVAGVSCWRFTTAVAPKPNVGFRSNNGSGLPLIGLRPHILNSYRIALEECAAVSTCNGATVSRSRGRVRERGVTRNRQARISGGKVAPNEARKRATMLACYVAIGALSGWRHLFTRDSPGGRMNRAGSCYLGLIVISTAASGPRSFRSSA